VLRPRNSALMIAPASGALKIAAMPAPSPAASAMFRSRADNLSTRATLDPAAAPICAIGPSRPDVSPPPMVMAEVINLKMDV
jgi:hypothetical protein